MDEKGFNPQYDDNKKPNIIYYGTRKPNDNGSTYRKVEAIIEPSQTYLSDKNASAISKETQFRIKDRVTLRETKGGQQKIHCWLVESEDVRGTTALHISRRTEKGQYGSEEVTLTFDGIVALKNFLDQVFFTKSNIDSDNRYSIPLYEATKDIRDQHDKAISLEEFSTLVKANIKDIDDLERIAQVHKSHRAIEKLERIIEGEYKNEIDVQSFLRANLWMFGNEYSFLIENNKINAKNIMDLAPANIESYIDIIEVKLPDEKLFNWDQSHSNYYPKAKLTKAIAQTQNYIIELEHASARDQYSTDRDIKILRPRGIVLFGGGVPLNDEETKSLRMLNSCLNNIQVMTYQQLLDKARNTMRMYEGK